MIQAEEAIVVRQAAIRESRAQANFLNLQNLLKLKNETDGALDQRNIQNALGKCPPLQRIRGLSGTVILGVHLVVKADQHVTTLKQLRDMPLSENVVHIEGRHTGDKMWFSGPRQAGT